MTIGYDVTCLLPAYYRDVNEHDHDEHWLEPPEVEDWPPVDPRNEDVPCDDDE